MVFRLSMSVACLFISHTRKYINEDDFKKYYD